MSEYIRKSEKEEKFGVAFKYNSLTRKFFDSLVIGDIIFFLKNNTSSGAPIRRKIKEQWHQAKIIFKNQNYLKLDGSGDITSIRFDEIVSKEILIKKGSLINLN